MIQYYSRGDIKNTARTKLAGNFGTGALLILCRAMIIFAVTLMANSIIALLANLLQLSGGDTGVSLTATLFSYLVSLLLAIFAGVFSTGGALFYLNVACGRTASFSDLFYGFRYLLRPSLGISTVMTLLYTACMLPGEVCYYLYANYLKTNQVLLLAAALVFLIGSILYLYFSIELSMAYFLLLDFPGSTAGELLRLSKRIMKGHKWEYFILQLSYIPMNLLGFLSCGIGFLWVTSYTSTTNALYFLDVMKAQSHHAPTQNT